MQKADDAAILHLIGLGHKCCEIARITGYATSTITLVLRRNKVPSQRCHNGGRRDKTPTDIQRAIWRSLLRRPGQTKTQLARRLRVDESAILNALSTMDKRGLLLWEQDARLYPFDEVSA
jgi:hypothetical protein